jgi:hypothetical protein
VLNTFWTVLILQTIPVPQTAPIAPHVAAS